ncbi:MAG: AAA family ATPase [Candidatus Peribacteraceae bacterium]|nr:AAA family ATPase [Candidatus Peribacteraceae bacterium]
MYLLRTTASSWKGLGDITIDFVKHTNLIGKNAAGKTAILDSVIDSFDKIDIRQLPNPINTKNNATTAVYEHHFTENGKDVCLKIKRMYRKTGNKNTLTIEPDPPAGFTNSTLLKALWPNASKLDIAELKRRRPEDWLVDIMEMMGISNKLNAIDREDKQLREDRLVANRNKETSAKRVPDVKPEKVELVDTDTLKAKLVIARQIKQAYNNAYSEWNYCSDNITEKQTMIKHLQAEIAELEDKTDAYYTRWNELADSVEAVANLEQQRDDADVVNQQARDYQRYGSSVKDAETQAIVWQKLDDAVKAIPDQRRKLFTNAKCSIPDIGMDDDGNLTYQDVPIVQINEGARLMLGATIALNKLSNQVITMDDGSQVSSLKLLMIENGSQADTDTRAAIRKLCDNAGVRDIFELVLGERWDDKKKCLVPDYNTASHTGIVIEEGEIYAKEN